MTNNFSYFPYPHSEGLDVTYPVKHLLDASNNQLKTPHFQSKGKTTAKDDGPLFIDEGKTVKAARKSMKIRELVSFKYELLEIVNRYYRRISSLDKAKSLDIMGLQSKVKKIHIQVNLIDTIISLYDRDH